MPTLAQMTRFDQQIVLNTLPPGNYSPGVIAQSKISVNSTTYTDSTGLSPCPSNAQIVLRNTSACVSSPDSAGNIGFWMPAGNYQYTITVPAGQIIGPIPITVTGSNITPYFPPQIFVTTIQGLPVPPVANTVYLINNGSSSTDCTNGGGTNFVWCAYNGFAWTAVGGSGGGGGTGGTVTSIGLQGTTNQITVTGGSPITNAGTWTLGIPNTFVAPNALQLSTTPTQCTGGMFSTGIAATGNSNCATPPSGGGGGGSLSCELSGSGVFTCSTLNFIPGDGVTVTQSNSPTGTANMTFNADYTKVMSLTYDQSGANRLCSATLTSNAYACNMNPTLTTYTQGQTINFLPLSTSTGSSTININSLGPIIIENNNNGTLGAINAGTLTANIPYLLTAHGNPVDAFIITGGPTGSLPGIRARAVTGTFDTVLFSDNNQPIAFFGSSAVSEVLPNPTSLGNPYFFTIIFNTTSASITVTPSTPFTINGSSTLVIASGHDCTILVNPNVMNDWLSRCVATV
jgi:hypothetical protein